MKLKDYQNVVLDVRVRGVKTITFPILRCAGTPANNSSGAVRRSDSCRLPPSPALASKLVPPFRTFSIHYSKFTIPCPASSFSILHFAFPRPLRLALNRSEEHTSELQSLR